MLDPLSGCWVQDYLCSRLQVAKLPVIPFPNWPNKKIRIGCNKITRLRIHFRYSSTGETNLLTCIWPLISPLPQVQSIYLVILNHMTNESLVINWKFPDGEISRKSLLVKFLLSHLHGSRRISLETKYLNC